MNAQPVYPCEDCPVVRGEFCWTCPLPIKLSEQIDKWIANEGKGNVRDALNIALGRLESADDLIRTLQDQINYLQDQCHSLMMGEES
jgi:hypothetical protein